MSSPCNHYKHDLVILTFIIKTKLFTVLSLNYHVQYKDYCVLTFNESQMQLTSTIDKNHINCCKTTESENYKTTFWIG